MRKAENKCLYWNVKNAKHAGSAKNEEIVRITSKKPSDMAVGRLLLQSFWANEAIFQLMMPAYASCVLCIIRFRISSYYLYLRRAEKNHFQHPIL
jgi:hypothetical protein